MSKQQIFFACSSLSPDDGKGGRESQPVDSQQMGLAGKRSGWVMRAAETATGSGDSSTHNDDLEKHTQDDIHDATGMTSLRSML